MAGAYKTGKYRNIFKEYGYPEEEIQKRVEDTLTRYSMGMMMNVFIMKPVMIWDIWRILAIMM